MAPSSSAPFARSASGITVAELASFQDRLLVFLSTLPVSTQPPMETIPEPGSTEELEIFRAICIELLGHVLEVRRFTMAGKLHAKAATIALAVLRCPLTVSARQATWLLAKLVASMLLRFREWCMVWYDEEVHGPYHEADIEVLKAGALENLSSVSAIDDAWKSLLVRVCGDLPELWHRKPDSEDLTAERSVTGEDGNVMAVDNLNTGSLETPQAVPQEGLDTRSLDVAQGEFNFAGGSTTANGFDQSHPFLVSNIAKDVGDDTASSNSMPYLSISNPARTIFDDTSSDFVPYLSFANPAQTVFDDTASFDSLRYLSFPNPTFDDSASSDSVPYPSFPNPLSDDTVSSDSVPYPSFSNPGQVAFDDTTSSDVVPYPQFVNRPSEVHSNGLTAKHSLPDLPFEVVQQNTGIGGFDEGPTGYNTGSLGQLEQPSGSGSVNYSNFQSGAQPSAPLTTTRSTPSGSDRALAAPTPPWGASGMSYPSRPNLSMASDAPPSSVSAMPMRAAGPGLQQGPSGISRRPLGLEMLPFSADTREAIAIEKEKIKMLTTHTTLLRVRTSHLADYLQMITSQIRFYGEGLQRLSSCEYLELPYPDEYRDALLKGPEVVGNTMVCPLIEWKQDIDV